MARYAGRKGLVYMSTSGTGTAVSVGSLTSWSLEMATDRFEVTSFGDSNKTYVQGLQDIRGSFDGFWTDDGAASLVSSATSSDGVKMYLYPSADAIGKYAYGPAWVDLTVRTQVGDAVRLSGTFAANGAWGLTKL